MAYKTKNGKSINFKVSNTTKNRFFLVDGKVIQKPIWSQYTITAYVDNNSVGYIKIGFIHKTDFDQIFPTLWHFQCIDGGWYKDILGYSPNINEWTPQQKCDLINNIDGYLNFQFTGGYKERYIMPANIDKVWEKATSIIEKFRKRYDRFKQYNCDRPIIDYINVDEAFKRQYIGIALYKCASKWLNKKFKMHLYASDTQTPEAQKTWDKMQSIGWVGSNEKGKFLNI